MDFRGFDSSKMLFLRGGILMSTGGFPESLSRAMLVGVMSVGGMGVSRPAARASRPFRAPWPTSSAPEGGASIFIISIIIIIIIIILIIIVITIIIIVIIIIIFYVIMVMVMVMVITHYQVGSALIALKFQCAQRDSLSELFL